MKHPWCWVLIFCASGQIALAQQVPPVREIKSLDSPLPANFQAAQSVQESNATRLLTIQEAVDFALANHPAMQEALAAVEEARGLAYQAGLYPNPRLDSGNPQTIGGANSVYSLGVTQEIVRGGKRQLDVAAAQRSIARLQYEYQQKKFFLVTEVRRGFVAALAAQERVEILESLAKIARELEKTTDSLVKAGQASEADLLLLRLERRRAETALTAANAELSGKLSRLAAQIGSIGYPIEKVAGELDMPIPNYEGLVFDDDLVNRNNLINAGRTEVQRSRLLLQRAIAEPIPNVTLQAGAQQTASAPHEQGLVGVYFDLPIWNRNQGNIRAAESSVRRNVAQVAMIQTEIAKQIAETRSRYLSAARQVQSYEEGVLPDARETLRLVRLGYDKGQFDIVRLVQAQRTVFEANLEYLRVLELRLDAAAEISGLLQSDEFP